MCTLILKRLMQILPILWIIASLTFILMHCTPRKNIDEEKVLNSAVKKLSNHIISDR